MQELIQNDIDGYKNMLSLLLANRVVNKTLINHQKYIQ